MYINIYIIIYIKLKMAENYYDKSYGGLWRRKKSRKGRKGREIHYSLLAACRHSLLLSLFQSCFSLYNTRSPVQTYWGWP